MNTRKPVIRARQGPGGRPCLPLMVLVLAMAWLDAALAASVTKPNIVLIMADDLGYECLGCDGGLSYRTPHLDALAAEGIRFEYCYSQPLCTPSRVKIMTGKYNLRNYEDFGYLRPGETTFGHVARRAGYATCIAGKWQLNGLSYKKPGFRNPRRPYQAGFDEYCLWQLTQPRKAGERYADALIERNGTPPERVQGRFGPDVFCDYVIDFIRRKRGVPFLVYYPMVLTHEPFVPTPLTGAWQTKRHQKDDRFFAAMVEYMDHLVGRIVGELDRLGLRQKTLVMFTGDNGTHRRIHSRTVSGIIRGGKGLPTDAGTHVPFIASWKATSPAGQVTQDLIDFSDFFPTIAELTGVGVERFPDLDGRSFAPRLRGIPGHGRGWVFCHYDPKWGQNSRYRTRFARDRRFKLYLDGRFFDLNADPLERLPLPLGHATPGVTSARLRLQAVLNRMPPWPESE